MHQKRPSRAQRRLWPALLVTLSAVAPAHATDGYFVNGIGAQAKGAGGVAIAYPQDGLAIAANPAAAAVLGHRLDVGLDIFVPDRSTTISGNAFGADGRYDGNDTNPFFLPEFAYIRPQSERVTLGLAVYGNGGMNTDYENNPFAAFGATGSAGVDLKQIFFTPTLALALTPDHSLGVSAIGLLQGFKAKGIAPFAAASADPGNFTDRGTDWATGFGVRVGWLGRLNERLSAGAFYQSEIKAGEFDRYAGLFADGGDFDVPASWGGGIALRLSERLDLAADVKRIEYSGIGSVGNPIDALFLGVPFGADGGPGFGWRDVTVYKLGVVYRLDPTWTLRAGYGHTDQPIRASQTLLNILAPGVVQDHYSVGATWTNAAGLEVSGHLTYAAEQTVRGRNSIPSGPPPGFGGGEADITLSELIVGVALGFTFD